MAFGLPNAEGKEYGDGVAIDHGRYGHQAIGTGEAGDGDGIIRIGGKNKLGMARKGKHQQPGPRPERKQRVAEVAHIFVNQRPFQNKK